MTRPARRAMNSRSVLAGRERQRRSVAERHLRAGIEHEIADLDALILRRPAPAPGQARRRQESRSRTAEQIVVGAAVEAADTRVDRVASRQDEDRRRRARRPQLAAETQAVAVGKAEVRRIRS